MTHKVTWGRACATLIGLVSLLAPALRAGPRPPARWLSESFGASHAGGKYSVPTRATPTDFLNEGADRMVEAGARCLKLWFTDQPTNSYPNFAGLPEFDWPPTGKGKTIGSMAALAAHSFYQAAFARPELDTFFLEATEFARVTWRDGLSEAERQGVVDEFQELTVHLLDAWRGSGKTFVLQNWEADNALNLNGYPADQWQTITDGFIAYMKARQQGVTQGRAAVTDSDVKVWNALEINWNWVALDPGAIPVPEEWTALNKVVRDGYTNQQLVCDLYSWSCWSAKTVGTENRMLIGLEYMRARVPREGPLSPDNLYVGEYGSHESLHYSSGATVHDASSDATHASVHANLFSNTWRGGARYALVWEIYCNETLSGVSFDPNNPVSLQEQDLKGHWLIRPPGPPTYPEATFTAAWHNYRAAMGLRLYADPLANLDHSLAHSSGWSFVTNATTWDGGDRSRVYRTSNAAPQQIDYEVEGELVDWNIVAFLYGGTSPAGRVRGYTSPDAQSWVGPFDFGIVDASALDAALPDWKRYHLKPPTAPPAGHRFLRVEVLGAQQNWATQLGDVRLVARAPLAPTSLQGLNEGAGTIRLTWPTSSRPGIWVIQRAIDTAPFTTIATLEPTVTLHDDTGLAAGHTHRYRVGTAIGPDQLAWSPEISAIPWTELQAWRARTLGTPDNVGDAADDADPDRDVQPNLLEFVLDTDPTAPDSNLNPPIFSVADTGGSRHMQISLSRAPGTGSVNLAVEASDDLSRWVSGPGETEVIEDTPTDFVGRDSRPIGSVPHRFLRVSARPEID